LLRTHAHVGARTKPKRWSTASCGRGTESKPRLLASRGLLSSKSKSKPCRRLLWLLLRLLLTRGIKVKSKSSLSGRSGLLSEVEARSGGCGASTKVEPSRRRGSGAKIEA